MVVVLSEFAMAAHLLFSNRLKLKLLPKHCLNWVTTVFHFGCFPFS